MIGERTAKAGASERAGEGRRPIGAARHRTARIGRAAVGVLCAWAAAGCASVLGIEELTTQDGGAGAGAASSGSDGGGSTSGGTAGSASTSTGGSASTTGGGGGSSTGSASTSDGSSGGSSGVTGSDGGVATTSGGGTTGSASTTGGSGSTGTSAGRDGGIGSTGSTGASGGSDAGASGGSDAGASGGSDAGATSGADGGGAKVNVVGTVVDYWRHPFPNVPVIVSSGGAQVALTTTGADGKFTVNDVPTPYEVSFVASTAGSDGGVEGWRYEGLTIDKPVLQTHVVASWQYAYVALDFTGAQDTDTVNWSLGSPDYADSGDITGPNIQTSIDWVTQPQTSGLLHVLRWIPDSSMLSSTQYLGYDAKMIALDSNATGPVSATFDVTQALTAASVSGTVVPSGSGQLAVDVYLTFADGARIPLFTDLTPSAANASFTVPTPAIPNATLSIVGRQGDWNSGTATALASRHGVAVNASSVTLPIPKPPQLTIPVDQAVLMKSAAFSWSNPTNSPTVGVVTFGFYDGVSRTILFNVVTTKTQTTIPTFPGTGLDIPNITACNADQCADWHVETYPGYSSVDQAASPSGGVLDAFDAFGNVYGSLTGIDDRDAAHATSDYRTFHF